MISWLRRNVIWIALLLIAASLFLHVYSVEEIHTAQVHACQQVEGLKTVLREIVDRSAHQIGQKGTAGYAYYKHHPQELADAQKAARTELSQFAPGRCN